MGKKGSRMKELGYLRKVYLMRESKGRGGRTHGELWKPGKEKIGRRGGGKRDDIYLRGPEAG